MSWWVYLEDASGPVEVSRHEDGGTYTFGGVDRAELNVTYNYAEPFREVLPLEGSNYLGKLLHEKKAQDTLADLKTLVEKLGTERSGDYWEPSAGNAGAAAAILLAWGVSNPQAVWSVS